jgi:SAM-dependent methyltransferase
VRCPACGGAFAFDGVEAATCVGCGAKRVREEGLWKMFQPDAPHDGDITQLVKSFYEAHPFPGYDESDTAQTMVEEARAGIYARQLGEQIPFNGRVLEVGCGTGQLSNYLGIAARTQFGADLCLNSLRLAEGFRSRQRLNHVRLVQMNLFKPCFAPGSFDVVLCNGVLLTTSDPEGGFRSIARLVKPGGHIVIGSYNTWGRLGVDARRVFFRLTGGRMRWVDPYIRKVRMSPEKEDAWFHDQYLHPNETKQSMGEILGWFDRAGIEFVNAVPKTTPWESYTEGEQLFAQAARAGAGGVGGVQMIQCGLPAGNPLRCRKACLMRRIIGGQQKVGLGKVLQVDKAVGCGHAGGDTGLVLHRLCPVQRPGAGRQPGGTGPGAALVAVIFRCRPHAQTVGSRFRAINARRRRPSGIGVPVRRFIPL